MPEQLSGEALGAVARNGTTNFPGCCNAKTGMPSLGGPDEERHEPPGDLGAMFVNLLEVGAPPDMLGRAERWHTRPIETDRVSYRSSETVKRFRPLARRRLSTC